MINKSSKSSLLLAMGLGGCIAAASAGASTWVPIGSKYLTFVPVPSLTAVATTNTQYATSASLDLQGFGQTSSVYYNIFKWQSNSWQSLSSWQCANSATLSAHNQQLVLSNLDYGQYRVDVQPAMITTECDLTTFQNGKLVVGKTVTSNTFELVNRAPVAVADSFSIAEDNSGSISTLGNDSDPDGHALTISSATAQYGSVNIVSGTSLSYTPPVNYHGIDSISYNITDNHGGTANSTVSITVTPVNDAPTTGSQRYTTNEDTNSNITLNAGDIDGDSLTYFTTVAPSRGTLTGSGKNRTYIPNSNFFGEDSFSYYVNDGLANSAIATVSLVVNPINDAPAAIAQNVSATEDISMGITLSGSDIENTPLSYTLTSSPSKGTLTGSGANLTYTPNSNVSGADSFSFKVNDGALDSASATVSINIAAVDDSPVTNGQSLSTDEDTGLAVTLTASDVDSGNLTYSIYTQPTHGTISGSANSYTYSPSANFNGSDSFTFRAYDGNSYSAPATVNITVIPVNDAPIANNVGVTTDEDNAKALVLNGTDVDGNNLTYTIVSGPTNGSLSGAGENKTYTPNLNFNGHDSFTYKVNDGSVDSNIATVSINVNAVNDTPTVNNINLTTNEDIAKAMVLNGTDVDGDNLTYTIVSGPAQGSLSGTGHNRTYTPNANYHGADSFTYKVNDGTVDSNTATVNISVTPVNDTPVANALNVSTLEDNAKAIVLNGTDIDGDNLTYTIVSGPTQGSLSGTGYNRTYTPNANYHGADSFTYKVNDGSVDSNTATVILTVTPVNDVPVISGTPPSSVDRDKPYSFTPTVSDADGTDTLTFSLAGNPSWLSVRSSDGLLSGTPTLSDVGTHSNITLHVSDNAGGNAQFGPFSIEVINTNQLPVVNAGADVLVHEFKDNSTVNYLSGSATDSDGTISSVQWTQLSGPAITLNNATTTTASYQAPVVSSRQYAVFRLTATDNEGESANDEVTVTFNDLPSGNIAAPSAGFEYRSIDNVYATATASDSDGSISEARFYLKSFNGSKWGLTNPGGSAGSYDSSSARWLHNFSTLPPGQYRVYANIKDNDGGTYKTAEREFSVNQRPVITAQQTFNLDIAEPLTFTPGHFTIIDDDSNHSLTIYPGMNYTISGTTITPDADHTGPLIVLVKANDGVEDSEFFHTHVSVSVNEITYYHFDHLGSTVGITDDSGTPITTEHYEPFGEKINDVGDEVANNSQWYNGKHFDDQSKLSYYGARYYDPFVGRFYAYDPIGFNASNPLTFNRYAYANNNPYKYVDPDGRAAMLLPPIDLTDKEPKVDPTEAWQNGMVLTGEVLDTGSDVAFPVKGAFKGGFKQFLKRLFKKSEETFCFVAGTKVKTPFGDINIEDVQIGDEVFAYDTQTKQQVVRKVTQTFHNWSQTLVDIYVNGEKITSTGTHRFYLPVHGLWVNAEDLIAGDLLLQPDNSWAEISHVEYRTDLVDVYNLEVDQAHNFYVGHDGVLVHNGDSEKQHDNYEKARNEALKWLEERGFKAEKQTIGKFGDNQGKPIGMQTENGKIGFRVEFDERSGAHINVWAGKEKGPHITFKGTQKDVNKIVQRFVCK